MSKVFGIWNDTSDYFNDDPIRGELYNIEHLEQYAQTLASEHKILERPKRSIVLLSRLKDNQQQLVEVYRLLADSIKRGRSITPAAEWLVDNFHIIEEQLREIREDLPKKFYYELPKLASGKWEGLPRIYAVALALITHTDSRLDAETMYRFLHSYQKVSPLSIGELWAVAINLRLGLVENLRRLATRIVTARDERDAADALADRILTTVAKEPSRLNLIIEAEKKNNEHLGRSFIVQLTLRLRDQDPTVLPVFNWLDEYLAKEGLTVEQFVQFEHQRQAAAQVTVGNIITSMRLLSTLDWKEFFESLSLVEPILERDLAGAYSQMDFATRDKYRHEIERISKRTKATELDVAERAVKLSLNNQKSGKHSHVGYYLIGEGVIELEKSFSYSPRLKERFKRAVLHHPTFFYLGTLTFLTLLIMTFLTLYASLSGAGVLMILGLWLIALIPASDAALSVLNFDVAQFLKPRVLPKMDYSRGIPEEAQTMVVVPTLLTSEENVEELIEKLEIHFLANQDEHLYFALLSDFTDAPNEEMPADSKLIEMALDGIKKLNERYGSDTKRFYLFHRRRLWNESENRWMGWERKRGKLEEFNKLLRGATDTSFTVSTANQKLLSHIRYVITLDSDTQLPRDVARRLVGVITHPLNRPRFDKNKGSVMDGYAVLQPRVSISLTSSGQSPFAQTFSGNTGIDPYTTAASDVYQDLFGEGIYTGKGLYDVDAFAAALEGRVPENALLSHDLFEGLYARCALVTDIELLDDYPAHYDTHAKRQHRWTRGDWQIAGWLFPRVRDAFGKKVRNKLPLISRWKILDNLRRSLVAPTLVLLFVSGWTFLPGKPLWWTLFVIATLAFPIYAHITTSLMQHPRSISWTSHFWHVWGDVRTNTAQIVLTLTMLAHQAYLMCDAIGRTLYRKLVSHRHLLEWMTAAQAEKTSAHDVKTFWRFMYPATLIAFVAAILIIFLRPMAIILAFLFLLLWIFSPLIGERISRRLQTDDKQLTPRDVITVRLIARRIWRFFETFVSAEENWLPPDNYQEDPLPVIAHRTSPTNIGLLLLSTVSARDFGYVGTLELVERLELTFAALEKLERFRGHFLNWYDTRTLAPLHPKYVSTVDSGNLAGHLIAVKRTCEELAHSPLADVRLLNGLEDSLLLMREEATRLGTQRYDTAIVSLNQLHEEIDACLKLVNASEPKVITEWFKVFETLTSHLEILKDIIDALSQEHGRSNFVELNFWITALLQQTRAHRRDLDTLLPWGFALTTHLEPILAQVSNQAMIKEWREITDALSKANTVAEGMKQCSAALVVFDKLRSQLTQNIPESDPNRTVAVAGLNVLTTVLEKSKLAAEQFLLRINKLAQTCENIFNEMDFDYLFDEQRKVFRIGYNVSDGRADNSYYDMLASEARLTSFIAIAKGDIPQEHWFRLGRQQTPVNGSRALVSWTATMFEYLMPLLVMRGYKNTLLDQTYNAIVERQIEYGQEYNVPWGVSESAYNARDLQLNYQYAPFGIPGLGLKRGLSEDLVIAPYATMLAAMVMPQEALKNLRHLEREGALARYGFYEAIDYTPARLPKKQKRAIIRSFMAHHHGMSLVALGNLLFNDAMQERFHAEPSIQATELLLQERVPKGIPLTRPRAEEVLTGQIVKRLVLPVTRHFNTANLPTPRTQLLSNGRYSVAVTSSGSSYSLCDGLAVTRWREDVTRDNWGNFIYLRDAQTGAVWSATHQPIGGKPVKYEVAFTEEKAEFWRHDAGLLTHTEIIVSAEDNAEVRRVSISNHTARQREIEITSYSEIVLAPQAADVAHPAFSNLFIETEFIPNENALIARRRPRSSKDNPIYGVHVIETDGDKIGGVQYETDRVRFLGRGQTAKTPVAITEDRPLSNTVGAVLDPIFSLRQRIIIKPQQTARISFTTALAQTHEEALRLADKYNDPHIFEREAALAWTRSQVEMHHLDVDSEEAHLFQRLASRILYSDPSLRPSSRVLEMNTGTQSNLWGYGISGDLPIVLVRISESQDLQMVRQIMRGHEYLRMKGLNFDLVILNDHPPSYIQSLQDELQNLVRSSGLQYLEDKPGGVFLRRADLMPDTDKILLHTVARVVLVTNRGSLEEQILRRPTESELPPSFVPRTASHTYPEPSLSVHNLTFYNGLGGFSENGREYKTVLHEGQWTPAPWLNVVANNLDFGFQVSETGAGFTWSQNSRENRLTPWSNDAVSDPPGEVIYLRDEDSGTIWTPTPLPIRESQPYTIRHGQGYSIFEHTSHGITQELTMFVPSDSTVKISRLRLQNRTNRKRRLSVTNYNELVLGFDRTLTAPFIITGIDKSQQTIFARNPYNNEFANRIAFVHLSGASSTATCDRKEFIGRNGSLTKPAALRRAYLSGRAGAGLDPCAALQTKLELSPDETIEIIILLGETETKEAAKEIIEKYSQKETVNSAFETVIKNWNDLLSVIEVRTPDAQMDTILNGWLLYQTLACRVLSRSAFYQSGGAYGFRDQLQDAMALIYSAPQITRKQILRAASRQFKEGDVQHWWHPPTGRGVRTRFSDDLLWLPYVTTFYVNVTGDKTVLDEVVPFLEAPLLEEGIDDLYLQPDISEESGSIYEHCVRAIERSLALGEHGLPLMGSGDWNDGMNRIGNKGKGESVWLAWFLHSTLESFASLCDSRKENERGNRYRKHLELLKKGLEENAWDGDWYRRAYFDDGTPLGSAQNEECKIDSIAQSWGVISGAADLQRAHRAMASVEEYLIRRGDGLVILFTPPFDHSNLDPGYIKGYVPGVRENGGQYTHAALWTLIAYAMLGDGDRAGELFMLLNPINHTMTRAGIHKYKIEPYVAAGDVYAVHPHTGRGGWSWYTGSASWMYRAGLEFILGFRLQGERLIIKPCIPRSWREYEIFYCYKSANYHIKVENPHGVCSEIASVEVDGKLQSENEIKLVDDGQQHLVHIVLGVAERNI